MHCHPSFHISSIFDNQGPSPKPPSICVRMRFTHATNHSASSALPTDAMPALSDASGFHALGYCNQIVVTEHIPKPSSSSTPHVDTKQRSRYGSQFRLPHSFPMYCPSSCNTHHTSQLISTPIRHTNLVQRSSFPRDALRPPNTLENHLD